jgi:uncharacterized protein (TIGR01777 family)
MRDHVTMRVVVAGSSGLLGTGLVPVLRRTGHEVIRLVRRPPLAPDERGWNPDEGTMDDDALAGAHAVVNLCGAGVADQRWSPQRKQVLVSSRTTPTTVLAKAVAEHAVPALLNASAVGYYGHTADVVSTEATSAGSGFLADLCRQWEAATGPAAAAGSRVVLLRSGMVLSPSGGLLGSLKPLFGLMLGGKLGDGTQYMPWISLDDELAAIRFLLDHGEISGPVNLTGPAPVTNGEFTAALGRAMRRPAPWTVPAFALRAALGGFADEVLHGQRALPTVLEDHGFVFRHPSIDSALAAAIAA